MQIGEKSLTLFCENGLLLNVLLYNRAIHEHRAQLSILHSTYQQQRVCSALAKRQLLHTEIQDLSKRLVLDFLHVQ